MTTEAMSVELAIPDPRTAPIPAGWSTGTFAELADHLDWSDLDDAEARLKGLASYIESLRADNTELQKALRIVEFRRGVLLNPDVSQGVRDHLSTHGKVEIAPATASRYRQIARFWDVVWPHIQQATEAHEVTQAAVLRLIDEHMRNEVGPERTEREPVQEPAASVQEPVEDEVTEADLIAELEIAHTRVQQLEAENESLAADDAGTELRKLYARVAQLEGRLQGAITEKNEAVQQAKRLTNRMKRRDDQLSEIQKELGVGSDDEIIPAIRALQRRAG